jgi:23S rRNA (guanosine2251-2'-O)-methyltransferase
MRKLTHDEIGLKRFSAEELVRQERFPLYILLDNIRSLYNVGSIFRSADGARVSGLILCGYTPSPPRKEIEKTALGATATVPWSHVRDPVDAVRDLKSRGIRICVLEQTGSSRPYYQVSKDQFPLCLVVGNEITGVSGRILREADCAVDIPMYGMKQSLNAAVALGITLFEFVRIWKSD